MGEPVENNVEYATRPVLILASKSPVRRLILANAGIQFDVEPASINEPAIMAKLLSDNVSVSEVAHHLATRKARAVSELFPQDHVIGADQTLELDGLLFSKPANMAEAKKHLQLLRGKTHVLRSAICLAQAGEIVWQHISPVQMTMRNFTEEEMEAVLAEEGEIVLSSVGAYRLEGPAIQLFERVEGDYFSVLGLPILPLLAGLRLHAPHLLFGARQ